MFKGSIVALITPWKNNALDESALKNLVEWHIQEGTQGLVLCGSTGESVLLTEHERKKIIQIAIETANKRIPIIVGCGAPSTHQAIAYANEAESMKADGILVVSPYYVKPSQEGQYQFFKQIHDTTNIPMIVYNNPGRTCVHIDISTVQKLAELPRIVGIKDSTFDLSRTTQLRSLIGNSFMLLGGDDPVAAGYLAHGGDGVISVIGNVIPKLHRKWLDAWFNRDINAFFELQHTMFSLQHALGLETNPCTVKFAMSAIGKCNHELRSPLQIVSSQTQQAIKLALNTLSHQDYVSITV
jgi:4-hydroxy-tetrahydrodipicolinate synthase